LNNEDAAEAQKDLDGLELKGKVIKISLKHDTLSIMNVLNEADGHEHAITVSKSK